uniref:Uncharacterized protein n=1 Tax=Eptatretus burgeri TaxID=7764 RepID=A0A8C4QZ33_EPTBU
MFVFFLPRLFWTSHPLTFCIFTSHAGYVVCVMPCQVSNRRHVLYNFRQKAVIPIPHRSYLELSDCIMLVLEQHNRSWPNADTNNLFVRIHQKFFRNCTQDLMGMEDLSDSIFGILIALPSALTVIITGVIMWQNKRKECVS